jgi:hypothetical protein
VRAIHRFLVFAVLVLAAPSAFAQTAATRFTGTVRDDQGGALPGAAVTAASPSLLGVQSVTSESNGTYQFPPLPAGTYSLTFELQGFRTVVRDRLVLDVGQTLTIDATLPIATLAETVVVTADAPIVDKQSTGVGNVLTAEKLTGVPTSTDMWGALSQAPGVRMSGFDVGGSHKIQSTGYDAFGIVGQVRTITEGVDTTEGSSGAGF